MTGLLATIRSEITNKRILIKPQFQGYDKTRCSHISAEQFRRVMKELRLIPPSEPLFQLLARKYFDHGNVREVNYVKFCHDVDHPEDLFPEYVPKHAKADAPVLQGQARNAGSSYYAGDTASADVVGNRFMLQRIQKANNPADVEDRLRAAVVMKRVRVEEFFLDFDKLRRGKIRRGQFEQVLSMLNFSLSEDEYKTLAERYKTADPEFLIDYKAFCASINRAFTTYGIQQDPLAKVEKVTVAATIPARRKYLEFNEDEKAALGGLLNEYRQAVQIRRVHLKPMFRDFDITQNQHVTKHQFVRILGQLGVSAAPAILNILLKAYMDKGNVDEVNYFDFCEDVDSGDALFSIGRDFNHSFEYYPKTRPRVTGNDISRAQPNDVDDIIARLRKVSAEQRIRISEFFRDFDKLRRGYITEAQFRIGLNMSKITLSGAEFRMLAGAFQAPQGAGWVLWRKFADTVDEVFTKKGLERSVDISLGDVRTESFYGQPEATADDNALVEGFKARFTSLVLRERLNARSFFQDQDRHNRMKITSRQFRQTCHLLKCELSDAEEAALVRVYGDRHGDVDYLRFINETYVLQYSIAEPFTGAKSTYRNTNTDFSGAASVDSLLKKIKDDVMRQRIRLGEFFKDHDPLRKGIIEASKFRTTLYAQKI